MIRIAIAIVIGTLAGAYLASTLLVEYLHGLGF